MKKFSRTLEQSAALSMSSPTAPGQIPGTSSSLPEMNRYDHPGLAADTFSDPLLRNGSFIDGSNKFSTSGHTTVKSNGDSYQAAPHSFSSANAAETETPTPKQPKSRRKVPVTMSPGASESANWLPPGWLVEDRVRTSGATAGTVDKYYIEPVTGRKFRSKKEVQYYLETGTLKKKKRVTENSEDDVNMQMEMSGLPSLEGRRWLNMRSKIGNLRCFIHITNY